MISSNHQNNQQAEQQFKHIKIINKEEAKQRHSLQLNANGNQIKRQSNSSNQSNQKKRKPKIQFIDDSDPLFQTQAIAIKLNILQENIQSPNQDDMYKTIIMKCELPNCQSKETSILCIHCQHCFHTKCLYNLIQQQIQNEEMLSCQNCQTLLSQNNLHIVANRMKDFSILEKAIQIEMGKISEDNIDQIGVCPNLRCSFFFFITHQEDAFLKYYLHCPKCLFKVCLKCLQIFHQEKEEEIRAHFKKCQDIDLSINENFKEKRCFKCKLALGLQVSDKNKTFIGKCNCQG